MSYTPINWQTGDTITADKMNKMDNGWEVSSTQLFTETVTTEDWGKNIHADLSYNTAISADEITVVFNGTTYICPVSVFNGINLYGGYNHLGVQVNPNYPFGISSEPTSGRNIIFTETAGTYTVSVSVPSVEVSDNFKEAVSKCVPETYTIDNSKLFSETVTTVAGEYGNEADFAYTTPITADTITVVFDGTSYTCSAIGIDDHFGYGGFDAERDYDFTVYPFAIESLQGNFIATETAGTHTVSVSIHNVEISDNFAEAVGKCVPETYTIGNSELFTETVTTAIDPEYPDDPVYGRFIYSTLITADTITVVFDGTSYTCPKIEPDAGSSVVLYGGYQAGDFDFTTYPFCLEFGELGNYLYTSTAGTHTVSVSAPSVEVSENFSTAVNKCVPETYTIGNSELFSETVTVAFDGMMTRGTLTYSTQISADEITVVFDGTSYICPRKEYGMFTLYGGFDAINRTPDFTDYPFYLEFSVRGNYLYAETAGPHTVSVSIPSIEVSDNFKTAVSKCVPETYTIEEKKLFTETVAIPAYTTFEYNNFINADSITVTFDGTEYVCQRVETNDENYCIYGGMNNNGTYDFTNYPFAIESSYFNDIVTNIFYTVSAGTYTVSISSNNTELFSGTITTEMDELDYYIAQFTYLPKIAANEIIVVFNGEKYICPKIKLGDDIPLFYGGMSDSGTPDFTNYPFCIACYDQNEIYVQSPGTYVVSVFVPFVEVSDDFSTAVNSCYTTTEEEELFDGMISIIKDADGFYSTTLPFHNRITAEKITVVFPDNSYTCSKKEFDDIIFYGDFTLTGPDFTNYPFLIKSMPSGENIFYTRGSGRTIISISGTVTNPTDNFKEAVDKCIPKPYTVDNSELFSETVTTVDGEFTNLNYSTLIDSDTISVTFDGDEYICSKGIDQGDPIYGAVYSGSSWDFSEYPFSIISDGYNNMFVAETAGTHTVSVSIHNVEISDNFKEAVNKCIPETYTVDNSELFSETVTTVADEDASYGNFSYSMLIDSDTIVVMFNGTAYTCQKSIDEMGSVVYGATHSFDTGLWDFSEYPFCISSSGEENYLVTETTGTYTVSVLITGVEVSDNFSTAVNNCYTTTKDSKLFAETVTTVSGQKGNTGDLYYSMSITASTITVIFDGTTYICNRIASGNYSYYGGFNGSSSDFTDFPFLIVSRLYDTSNVNSLITETAGTYTVSVSVPSVEVSDNFAEAVGKCMVVPVFTFDRGGNHTCNLTYSEILEAFNGNKLLYAKSSEGDIYQVMYVIDDMIAFYSIGVLESGVELITWTIESNGSISFEQSSYPSN